jgi:folate-binding protein YgfZ
LLATGRDVLSFVHSQVTNEVQGLQPGQGNQSARVSRTGQLLELFSVHRIVVDEAPALLLVVEAERVPVLLSGLDESLFADDVTLRDVTGDYLWSTLQGPAAAEIADTVASPLGGHWSDAKACSVHSLEGDGAPPGTLAIARSLTGDAGIVFLVPAESGGAEAFERELQAAAEAAGCAIPDEPQLSQVIELMRVEAGVVRIGPDTTGRKRILPETGLEQHAVSYTKGCYVGQEVIARVRTYGSLPFGLRGLVLEREPAFGDLDDDLNGDLDEQARVLDALPAPGEALVLEDGSKVGQLASRTLSPVLGRPVTYAYIDKTHRTPGTELALSLAGESIRARVVLLPFHAAPDQAERVAQLYDRSVRNFAQGRADAALEILEEALRIDPSFSDGYEALGVMMGRSERFHEAIDIFKRLEEIAPEEPMVNTNLSLYYMKIGDKESAEKQAAVAMHKSMAHSAGRAVDDASLERALDEQNRKDALRKRQMFEQVLEIDPVDGVALFGLGNALAVLEEWGPAEAAYASARVEDPDNSAVYLAHGKVFERLDRPGEAVAVYRAGMEVASRKGDLMPLKEMEHRALLLSGGAAQEAAS